MHSPNSFDELYALIKLRKVPFFLVFFFAVLFSYGILFAIDFIPEPIKEVKKEQTAVAVEDTKKFEETVKVKKAAVVAPKEVSALPIKIIFDSLNKEVKVSNPTSRTVEDLDAALLKGAVRHPDSADFTHVGNIFILAHSSYLPNVINKNFQAFNGIQKLTWGDMIRLQSADTEYVYRVEKVYQAKASDEVVPATPGKARLTLATCNSFKTKNDRFVVEAVLIDTKSL